MKENSITSQQVTAHFFGQITYRPATHDHDGKPYADQSTHGEIVAGYIQSDLPETLPYAEPEPGDYIQDVTAASVSDAAPLLDILRRAVAYTESTDPDSGEPSIDATIADTLIREVVAWAKESGGLTGPAGIEGPPSPVEPSCTADELDPHRCRACPNGQARTAKPGRGAASARHARPPSGQPGRSSSGGGTPRAGRSLPSG